MKQLRVGHQKPRERAEFEIKLSQGRVRIDNCSGRSLISTARRRSLISACRQATMADELWKWCRNQRFSEPMTCRFVAAYGEMSSLLACARDEAVVKETLVEVGVPAGQRNQMLKAVRALAATLSVDDEAAPAVWLGGRR